MWDKEEEISWQYHRASGGLGFLNRDFWKDMSRWPRTQGGHVWTLDCFISRVEISPFSAWVLLVVAICSPWPRSNPLGSQVTNPVSWEHRALYLKRLGKKCGKLVCIFVHRRVEEDRACMPQAVHLLLCHRSYLPAERHKSRAHHPKARPLPRGHWNWTHGYFLNSLRRQVS